MKFYCADCGKFMAELEGKLRRGGVILCAECHGEPEDFIRDAKAVGDDEAVSKLLRMLGISK